MSDARPRRPVRPRPHHRGRPLPRQPGRRLRRSPRPRPAAPRSRPPRPRRRIRRRRDRQAAHRPCPLRGAPGRRSVALNSTGLGVPRKVSQRARRARRVKGPGFASGPVGPALRAALDPAARAGPRSLSPSEGGRLEHTDKAAALSVLTTEGAASGHPRRPRRADHALLPRARRPPAPRHRQQGRAAWTTPSSTTRAPFAWERPAAGARTSTSSATRRTGGCTRSRCARRGRSGAGGIASSPWAA